MFSRRQQEAAHKPQDLTKEELEKEKIGLEIVSLRHPWRKKPDHVLYVILTICSLGIGFVSGKFQADSTNIKTERQLLAQENKDIESKRDVLHKDLDQTVRERESFKYQLSSTAQELASTKQELTAVRQKLELAQNQHTPEITFSTEFGNLPTKPLGILANGAITTGLISKSSYRYRDIRAKPLVDDQTAVYKEWALNLRKQAQARRNQELEDAVVQSGILTRTEVRQILEH